MYCANKIYALIINDYTKLMNDTECYKFFQYFATMFKFLCSDLKIKQILLVLIFLLGNEMLLLWTYRYF